MKASVVDCVLIEEQKFEGRLHWRPVGSHIGPSKHREGSGTNETYIPVTGESELMRKWIFDEHGIGRRPRYDPNKAKIKINEMRPTTIIF